MNKVFLSAGALFIAAIVSTAAQSSAPVPAKSVTPADHPSNYQEMVSKYCMGCHNTRNPLPAGAPLALD